MNVPNDVMERVKKAKPKGGHSRQSDAAFLGYLIGIGINVYERQILPAEEGYLVGIGREAADKEDQGGDAVYEQAK
jgi:hypothetical protein